MSTYQEALNLFKKHYADRFGEITVKTTSETVVKTHHYLDNEQLKEGNGPRLLFHDTPKEQVIVLTHGLTDCPYYVLDIARRFYAEGYNVVLPLLDAHGLKNPDKAMEDKNLDQDWRATVDNGVAVAKLLGGRISIGGFSTGGALSLNKILRDPTSIDGKLLLLSGALSIGKTLENVGKITFLQSFLKLSDGEVAGIGPNPYKYPEMPSFAGSELVQVINENNDLLRDKKLQHPVLAAQTIHDETVELSGLTNFLEHQVERGLAILISEGVAHDTLTLEFDVIQDETMTGFSIWPSKANPKFDWMMEGILRFFRED